MSTELESKGRKKNRDKKEECTELNERAFASIIKNVDMHDEHVKPYNDSQHYMMNTLRLALKLYTRTSNDGELMFTC